MELISSVIEHTEELSPKAELAQTPVDVLITSLATGSVDYIKWVREATAKNLGTDRFEFEDEAVTNDPGPNTGVASDATA
jgi:hypothetical protein